MLETKQLLETIGVPEAEIEKLDTAEKVKEYHDSKFVSRTPQAVKDDQELYDGLFGAYNEANKVSIKRTFKDSGIDISDVGDASKLPLPKFIETVIPAKIKALTSQIEALKAEGGKSNDEKVISLQKDYEEYKKSVEPKIAEVETLKIELEKKDKQFGEYKKGRAWDKVWNELPWSDQANTYTRKGFMDEVLSTTPVALNDKDELIPVNDKGEPLKDDKGNVIPLLMHVQTKGAKAVEAGIPLFKTANRGTPTRIPEKKEFKVGDTTPALQPRKIDKSLRPKTQAV